MTGIGPRLLLASTAVLVGVALVPRHDRPTVAAVPASTTTTVFVIPSSAELVAGCQQMAAQLAEIEQLETELRLPPG
jgi:hypothetical protein